MSDLSARLDLPLIKPSQAQKHVTHNEAIQILDGLVQAVVEETGAETPPFEPVAGQLFALGTEPTGDWAGEGGKLALRVAEAWLFLTPREGWRVWDRAAGRYRVHDGAAWTDVAMDLDNLEGVGIGTTPDATNRLAVASPASLFTHEGAGHRLKVNKAADTDTASLLFQSGFTGHAEMGLAGGNDWSIKVSPDGSTWTEALVVDKDTGRASGAAVQQTPSDATAGRLLPVGAGGLVVDGNQQTLTDLDATDTPTGFYRTTGDTLNIASRPPNSNGFGYVLAERYGPDAFRQIFCDVLKDERWHRNYRAASGGYGEWRRIYDGSNVVGTVSNDAGGDPDGAVIERGSNANGEYVRFADGTQIATNRNAAISTAPAAFTGTITKIDSDKLWIGRWF